jgi:hypothetical protein
MNSLNDSRQLWIGPVPHTPAEPTEDARLAGFGELTFLYSY